MYGDEENDGDNNNDGNDNDDTNDAGTWNVLCHSLHTAVFGQHGLDL
jgi:hypothetical protein